MPHWDGTITLGDMVALATFVALLLRLHMANAARFVILEKDRDEHAKILVTIREDLKGFPALATKIDALWHRFIGGENE